MRQFDTGATRSPLADKPQYEGYLNPLVIKRFGEYMLKHQTQADGTRRDADNWQKGIPRGSLMDSAWRHMLDVWLHHRGNPAAATEPLEEALCAVMFNTMAYLLRTLETAQLQTELQELEKVDLIYRECPATGRPAHRRGTDPGCVHCAAYNGQLSGGPEVDTHHVEHTEYCPKCGAPGWRKDKICVGCPKPPRPRPLDHIEKLQAVYKTTGTCPHCFGTRPLTAPNCTVCGK